MIIDEVTCTGCGNCLPYCTVGAIVLDGGIARIDSDECVECGVCIRSDACPTSSFVREHLPYPRSLRAVFSDVDVVHEATGVFGRGTEEIKTNDVTGRIPRGTIGVGIELGRPGVGARLRDVDRVARAVAPLGGQFEPQNPVTLLMTDVRTGALRQEALGEKVLSAIVELKVEPPMLPALIARLREVATEIDTVFILDLACRVEEDGSIPLLEQARQLGLTLAPNGKTNIGLGRPLRT